MVNVPDRFRPHINTCYPPNNCLIFEEWFYRDFVNDSLPYKTFNWDIEYLPIFWTSFYVNHKYGKDQRAMKDLQRFINSLDRSKKYFTVLQYDDGILNDVSRLDLKVFGSGNMKTDFPIPLLTARHPYEFDVKRDIFANFVGSITHPIRSSMIPVIQRAGFYVDQNMAIEDYCRILSSSVFTLAPRGYGVTSFRICEALQYGSIPVYISDQFLIPYNDNFEEYGVLIHASEVSRLHEILSQIPESEIRRKQEVGRKIYNEKFSFEGCKRVILENL